MMKTAVVFLFLLSGGLAWGQSSTRVAADCTIPFGPITATGRTPAAGFANGSAAEPGCVTWTIVYYSTGFSVLSLRLDSAPDSSGVAGTWGAFSGTLLSGINPNTAITQAFTTVTGYNPWVSVDLVSKTGTGTIRGVAYGWKTPAFVYTSATTTPSGTQDVNLIKVAGAAIALGQAAMAASLPVVIASNQSAVPVSGFLNPQPVGGQAASGAADAGNPVKVAGSNGTNDYNLKVDSQGNNYHFLGCTLTAETTLTGTGYIEVVVGTAAQVIQVCKVFITSATGGSPNVNSFSLVSATIATCAGTTELFAAASITGLDSDWGGALRSGSGKSLCFSESVANGDKITISYAKF
jgi:hypothetical protein